MTLNFYEKLNAAAELFEKTAKAKAEKDNSDVIFPANSKQNSSNKDKFPIGTEAQAKSALQKVNQFSEVPEWYNGSLESLVKTVAKKVKSKYKNIEVSEKSKKPGKG
jgi:hypothetical protein